ncbi:MAG: VanW family protein [Eubacteriales bacterium]|nr:VanW family protein [Eubacteriales bacterium]
MARRRTNKNYKNMHGYNGSRAFDKNSFNSVQNNNIGSGLLNYNFNESSIEYKPAKRNRKKWVIVLLVFLFLSVVSISIYFYIDNNNKTIEKNKKIAAHNAVVDHVSSFDNVFANGIYVDGISLGGLSYEEGKALVQKHLDEKKGYWQINVLYEGQNVFTINNNTISHDFDSKEALQKAWEAGKSGDVYERQAELKRLAANRTDFYSIESDVTLDKIDEALQQIKSYSHIEPVNAQLLGFDNNLDYPFVFEPEVYGRDIDIESARNEILNLLDNYSSGDVELKANTIPPAITKADLMKKYRLLSKATTEISKASTEERTENIRIAFSRYNGMRIKPGKWFSFNNIVGQRTPEKGFLPAIEYAYGELVEGYGGGVCQASTTTYLAALKSGLKIVKRYPHSMPVNYTELGQDATVYLTRDRNIDFIFENNTGKDIYLRAQVVKNPKYKKRYLAEVSIYGYSEDAVEYRIESIVVEELDPPLEVDYIKDNDAKYVTYTDQEKVVDKAKKGFVIETYLIKLIDGMEVDRRTISTDTYKPKKAKVYVGVTPRY